MSDRKRKRKSPGGRPKAPATAAPAVPPRADGRDAMKRGYAKAELKNQAVRESLVPLTPGERPRIVVAAVAWLALIAAVMLYNAFAANDLAQGTRVGNVFMVVLIVASAVGTWMLQYWALLGTQTLLALTIVSLVLAAMVLTNVLLILLAVAGTLISGLLFRRLITVMARVQKTAMRDRDAAGLG